MEQYEQIGKREIFRILHLFERLNKGEILSREQLSKEYSVTEKTIQRDIGALRDYLGEAHNKTDEPLPWLKSKGGYILQEKVWRYQTNQQILAAAKILLESRAFVKDEIKILIDNLVFSSTPEQRPKIREMLNNELFHYHEPQHRRPLFDLIWQLSEAIFQEKTIEFHYTRQDGKKLHHIMSPLAILFSEYYFYLIGIYLKREDCRLAPQYPNQKYPVILRADRLEDLTAIHEKYIHPYSQRFEAGELRKRIQFMYGGDKTTVVFRFWGSSIEAVKDRLPTAIVTKEPDGKYLVQAEVFGEGIKMWLFTQMDKVEVLSPPKLRDEMEQTAKRIVEIYQTKHISQ